MAQVEGGDLLVIQRGQEATARRGSEPASRATTAGWTDGPWWRQSDEHRDLGAVKGLVEGTKLVRVSAEAFAHEFFTHHGGLDVAMTKATEDLSESNPVRTSDIFLAVQAISHPAERTLFQPSHHDSTPSRVVEEEPVDELITFAIYLADPVHSITFSTITQAVPAIWLRWLDAARPVTGDEDEMSLPDEIREILESGGVDPREWVAEWVEEQLTLGTGIVAQRYVARRMGVGEGGLGRGKAKVEEVVGDGGGEAARAGLI